MSLTEMFLFAFPLVIGIALLLISRWARKRSRELSERRGLFMYDDFPNELRRGHFRTASRMIFFGDVGPHDALIARGLALVVIIGVVVTLVGVALVIALK